MKSRLLSEFKESFRGLGDIYNIRLCWVPGHCNDEGNEVARNSQDKAYQICP